MKNFAQQPTLNQRPQNWLTRIVNGQDFVCMFALIVIAGVVSRIWMIDEPNFKPVGALALFAGFYFQRIRWSVATIVGMMLISDLFIGFYEPWLMLAVYSSLAICGGLGWCCQCFIGKSVDLKLVAGFGLASLIMSCGFFVITNFAVWASGVWYPTTTEGLISCFTAAIPFFRNTVASDLLFSQSIVLAFGWVAYFCNAHQGSRAPLEA